MSLPAYIQQLNESPLGMKLWQVTLDANLTARERALLSVAEQDRAARFRFAHDARRYNTSHVALRLILAHVLELADPARIHYQHNAFGKPGLDTGSVHFNMSHSGDWALIGVSDRHAIGVDLEVRHHPMPDTPELARRHFTAAEYSAFLASPVDQREATFLRCWTRKEACLKAIGSGLSIEPHGFEAGMGPEHQAAAIATPQGLCQVEVVSLSWPTRHDAPHAAVARLRDDLGCLFNPQ